MEHFEIKLIRGDWFYTARGQIDEVSTIAFRDCLSRLDENLNTGKAIAKFIVGFANLRMDSSETPGVFETEIWDQGNDRLSAYLEHLGFTVKPSDRADGADWVNKGDGKNFGRLSMFLKCLHLFLLSLARQGVRSKQVPTRIEDWNGLDFDGRADLKNTIYKNAGKYFEYTGMALIISKPTHYAIRIEDPRGLGPRMVAAAIADGWTTPALNLLKMIHQTGSRFNDIAPTTALDWWTGSRFGLALDIPLKRSGGERLGHGIFDEQTRQDLIAAFDDDPDRPDFAELDEMAKNGETAALDKIFLFPSRLRVPFSHRTYTKYYVRPSMVRHSVEIVSSCGSVRSIAALHRLRAASIQHGIEIGFDSCRTDRERLLVIDKVRQDHHIKTQSAFDRYLGNIFKDLGLDIKIARVNARREAINDKQAVISKDRGSNGLPSRAEELARQFV